MLKQRVAMALAMMLGLVAATSSSASAEVPVAVTPISPSAQGEEGNFRIVVSGDGIWAAYVDPDDGLGIMLWNRDTRTTTEIDPAGNGPAISSDGRWIAFQRSDGEGGTEVVLKDRLSTGPPTILSSGGTNGSPSISDDGSVVAWTYFDDFVPVQVRVWQRSNGTVGSRGSSSIRGPLVSGNGRYVLYPSATNETSRWDLDTGVTIVMASVLDFGYDDFSADGNTVLYGVRDNGNGPARRVALHTIDGNGDIAIDTPPDESGVGAFNLEMSSDASIVTFKTPLRLDESDQDDEFDVYLWAPAIESLEVLGTVGNVLDLSDNGSVGVNFVDGTYGYLRIGLRGGTVEAATTVNEILAASDYTAADANLLRLYRAFFNREPDPGGAVYWIDISRNGSTLIEIAQFFTAVPEYRNVYDGTTDQQFLTEVYDNVLGRDFDQGGYNYWLDFLQGTNTHGGNPDLQTLSRGEVVRWVTGSTEFKTSYPYDPITD